MQKQTSYYLMRKTIVGINPQTNEEVFDWEEVPNSEQTLPYTMNPTIENGWKQYRRIILEEEITSTTKIDIPECIVCDLKNKCPKNVVYLSSECYQICGLIKGD